MVPERFQADFRYLLHHVSLLPDLVVSQPWRCRFLPLIVHALVQRLLLVALLLRAANSGKLTRTISLFLHLPQLCLFLCDLLAGRSEGVRVGADGTCRRDLVRLVLQNGVLVIVLLAQLPCLRSLLLLRTGLLLLLVLLLVCTRDLHLVLGRRWLGPGAVLGLAASLAIT